MTNLPAPPAHRSIYKGIKAGQQLPWRRELPLAWVEGSSTGQGTPSAWGRWSWAPVRRGWEGGIMWKGELCLLWGHLERVQAETMERQSRRRRFVHSLSHRGFLVVVVVSGGLTKSSFGVMGLLVWRRRCSGLCSSSAEWVVLWILLGFLFLRCSAMTRAPALLQHLQPH